MALSSSTSSYLNDITKGGVACAQQGDLNTCYLVFLSENVALTCLAYFLTNDTTLHLRVKVRCMHHTEHDWFEIVES